MIAFLSLVVAILAVCFGPLVAWTTSRQQISVAARESWMREFREKVAVLLTVYDAFLTHIANHTTTDPVIARQLTDLADAQTLHYHAIRLLIAEKGQQYPAFIGSVDRLLRATSNDVALRKDELFKAAEDILQREQTAIEADPGIWSALLTSVRLR